MEQFATWNLLDKWTLLVGFFVFLVLFRYLRRPKNLPPGPRGWPIVGNLPQLVKSGEEMHETISKLAARYGNVVWLSIAGLPVVVLHGFDTVKEAFGKHQLSARPTFHMTESLAPDGKGVVASSGELWVELRRFTLTVLRGLGVGKTSFEENISAEAETLADEVKKLRGTAFDPKHLVGNAVSNIICSVVFGKRFQYTDSNFKRLLEVLTKNLELIGAGGILELSSVFVKLQMLPFVRRYAEAVRRFLNQVHRLLVEHKNDANNPNDLIDMFLHEKQIKDEQGTESLALQTENLTHVVTDLFGAGSETTSTTLRWGILYMMAYPEIQTQVQKELDEVTGRNRFPQISDKPSLPYTEAVLCEIQRMGTIVPLGVPHLCSEDTTLQGYTIPKGTIVFFNIWHNHFDPAVWHEPRRFRPERFLDKDGKFRPRKELTPFGIGRRICLGEHLAKMELFIFFTRLLHHFAFKKPEEAPPLSFKGVSGVTFAPAEFTVCLIARE